MGSELAPFAVTAIFSVTIGIILFSTGLFTGIDRGRREVMTCSLCEKEFRLSTQFEWHIMSMCETQCMDDECIHREYLGFDHSTLQHESEYFYE